MEIVFGLVVVDFDRCGGEVVTRYADGHWTGGPIVPEDEFHAAALGMTEIEHRLHHELAHQVVGSAAFGVPHSPVLWRAAHGEQQPKPEAEAEEWFTTAVQYHARGRSADYGALVDLQGRGLDVRQVSDRLRTIFDAAASSLFARLVVE